MAKIILYKKEEIEKFWEFLRQNPTIEIELHQDDGSPIQKEVSVTDALAKAVADSFQKPKFPTFNELESFILSLPNGYSHTIHQVAEYFLGYKLKYDPEKPEIQKQYNKLWIMLDKVRRKIVLKQNGEWHKKKTGEFKFGMPVLYTFTKK